MKTEILEKEADDWFRFCSDHPSMQVVQTCIENISPISSGPLLIVTGPCKSSPCADKTHGKLWTERRCPLAYKY